MSDSKVTCWYCLYKEEQISVHDDKQIDMPIVLINDLVGKINLKAHNIL